MGVTPFPAIDPATSYRMMTGGAGPGPTLATGEAYDAHAATMTGAYVTSQVKAVTTFADWTGAGGTAAEAALVTHNTQHLTHADETLLKAALFQQAATLHSATVTRMVPHVLPDANRMESAVDNAINPWVFGALTPRITELELEYQAMWVNNAQAGVGYGFGLDGIAAALAGLAGLPALAGGSLAAPAMAAAQIGETAAISGLGAAMSTTEQAATAAISPAMATTTSSTSPATNSLLGDTPLAAPSAAPTLQPMSAVTTHPAPTSPSLTHAQTPVMGMFAPPPTAAVTPAAPSPALPATPPPAPVTPPMPGAAPGVTSFVRPAQPFSPPPPTAGRAAGLGPGMLNAAALRGPVTTMPLTTTATSTLATATQPLAYVSPTPPPPEPAPSSQALLQPGTINTLQPPATPQQTPPAQPLTPPAVPQSAPPAPSTGPTGPGTNGIGVQMLGNGPPGAPQAPPGIPPIPLDPSPPVPAPPSPGVPPLQRPDVSGWTAPQRAQDAATAQKNLQDLEDKIQYHNEHPPNTSDASAVALYNSQANYYNSWAAQLEAQVESYNADYTPPSQAKTVDNPLWWAHPAPEAHAPTGQRGGPMEVEPGTNAPQTIDGILFGDHALDEMQSDGIPLSAVQRALNVGAIEPGKLGRTIFYDAANNISVIQEADGTIVTVSYGHLHA